MQLPQLPADKANHALYGAAVFVIVCALAAHLGRADIAQPIGALGALLVACAKEAIDIALNRRAIAAGLPPPHGVEAADIVATTAGALVCWLATIATGGA
jgi:hypothetical protein